MARSVKSARRALEVLDLFEKLRRPAAIGEIAAMLGYPQSSTSFLLNDLRRTGYLNYDLETRCFAPTIRVALLGSWIHAGACGRDEISELLTGVRDLARMTTLLATQNGLDLQYVHVIETRQTPKLALRPGTLRPLCRGAGGLALLAERSDADIGRLVRSINADTAGTHEDLRRVLRYVDRTRRDGYAWIVGGVFPNIGSVAVRLPFNDILDKPLGLMIAGPAWRIRSEHRALGTMLRTELARFTGRLAVGTDRPS